MFRKTVQKYFGWVLVVANSRRDPAPYI